MQCARCNRNLKDKKSIERGFGPVCYKKHQEEEKEFLKKQVTLDEALKEAN
ncbi:hypothetical protein SAMN05421676_11234 [Salinibacillus kushneri]|uniref:Uncharacterized protein n=1 Tax=Salinibacillus kushneri TaxID=237682 RepID=A0A1I0IGF2_9BACI|nr:DUF6011 domain-containing protein [Salinibacillus kushneri]SET95135.1 hypothetical protein SAMN05421676_11234 [Salinibacillus kushneri]